MTFYVHRSTGEKLWEEPPAGQEHLYETWEFDPETGEVSQQAVATRDRYPPPEEEEDSNDTEGSTGIEPAWRRSYSVPPPEEEVPAPGDWRTPLPDGWLEQWHDGRPYYVNTSTHETTWIRPKPEAENEPSNSDPPPEEEVPTSLFQRLRRRYTDTDHPGAPTPVNPQPEDENDSAGWLQHFLGSRKKEDSPRKKTKKKKKKKKKKKSSKKKPSKLPESTTILY